MTYFHQRAVDEGASLSQMAEHDPDEETALSALLIAHSRDNLIGWTCLCGHKGQIGESHARHQAAEVLALLNRRNKRAS